MVDNKKNDMENLNNNIAAMPPQQTSTNVEQDNQSISNETIKSAETQIKTWLKDNVDCKYFIEYLLLKKGTQEYLHDVRDAVVMSIEVTKGSRRFYWIYNEKSAEAFVQYISLTLKLEAHDIICSPRCRMFFDIDLMLDAIDFDDIATYYNVKYGKAAAADTADALGKTLAGCYFRAMKLSLEAHGIDDSETAGIDYMATMRNRELADGNYKISIHIITNVMFNVSMCKAIIEDIKSDVIPNNIEVLGLPEDYVQLINDAIDAQPYGRNKSLGMPFGFKNEVHQSWVARDYVCAGQKYFLTRWDIMTIQDMIPIGYQSNEASVTFDSSSPEFVKRALAHVGTIPDWSDDTFSANPDSLKGAFIQAKRHKSSQCSLCNRCHDNDNTLQLIFNESSGIALWKCIRSKERAKLFYKEYPDAEDTDLEAFAGKKLAQAGSKRKPVKKQRAQSFDLDDPFDSHEHVDVAIAKDTEEPAIDTSSPHNESLYSLCCLLPAKWLHDAANTWKLARTIYETPADPKVMRNTYALIMQHHLGEYYDQKRVLAQYDKDGPSATEKFPTSPLSLTNIKKMAGGNNSNEYAKWKRQYDAEPSMPSTMSAEEKIQQLDDLIIDEIGKAISTIGRDVIYENNGIEATDLFMMPKSTILTVDELALLIRQTIVRNENGGRHVYLVKIIAECKYNRSHVDFTKFEARKPFEMKVYSFNVQYEDNIRKLNLLRILDGVKDYISFKKVVVEPYGALESDKAHKQGKFNMFTGFVQRYDENFSYDLDIVKTWTDHLRTVIANGDESVYKYLLHYFKHILVNPMVKTGVAIVIKGKQGSGKNAAFDIFYRYVLGPSLAMTMPNIELITGRFNSISQSLIGCVLDEAVDNADRSVMNKFKNLVTCQERQIELKGVEPYTVNDFANYVVISNNDFASLVEESDRRTLCLETCNDMIGNRKYFNNYWKVLSNMEAGKHIFHWLLNEVQLPEDWHPQGTPETSYKKELKQAQASSPIKFLLDLYEKMEHSLAFDGSSPTDTDQKKESTAWWEDYKEFCVKNNYRMVSSSAFYKHFKNHSENKKSNGKNYKLVTLDILRESLKAYL